MKTNKLFFLSIFLIVTNLTFAQGGFRVATKLGLNYSRLSSKNITDDKQIGYFPSISSTAGIEFGYNVTYFNYGFTLGFLYRQYGQLYQQANTPIPIWQNKYKVNYLDIPFLVRFRPTGDKGSRSFSYGGPYLELGVQASLLMNATQSNTSDSLFYPLPINSNITNIKDQYESFALAGVIGFGAHHAATEHFALTHGLRATFSLTDIKNKAQRTDFVQTDGTTTPYKPFKFFSIGYMMSIEYKF